MSGLIVASVGNSMLGEFPGLVEIDPDTGTIGAERNFSSSNDSVQFADWYLRINGTRAYTLQRTFSPAYDRVVAVRSSVGEEGNVSSIAGYIDESGSFTDMTASAPPVGDFDSSVDGMPAFDESGALYFARRPPTGGVFSGTDITALFRVPDGSNTAEALTPTDDGEFDIGYTLTPDGSVENQSPGALNWFWNQAATVGCWSVDDVSINDLCVQGQDDHLRVWNAVPLFDWGDPPDELMERDVLPETNSRDIKSAVFSPDGSEIAFLASDSTGDEGYDLYRVSVEGGDPTKVPLGYQLDDRQIIIDWTD